MEHVPEPYRFPTSGRDEFTRLSMKPNDDSIFRDTDIRGLVTTDPPQLSPLLMRRIGRAFGTMCRTNGIERVAVSHDAREYSEELALAYISGLLAAGMDVRDIGLATTPMLYFAQHHLGGIAGTSVTASHNPNGWAGLKMSLVPSSTLTKPGIQEIHQRVLSNDYVEGRGTYGSLSILDEYANYVSRDLKCASPLHLLSDGGNSVSGPVGRLALELAGHRVTAINENLDWSFPNHEPDPERLDARRQIAEAVLSTNADVGLGSDGDGDRLGVTDEAGRTIWSDQVLALLAIDILARHPGAPIIYDVKCSRVVPEVVRAHGGRPVMCKTGHSHIKAAMREHGAPLGGERSGHFFNAGDYLGFDDGCYAGIWLSAILSKSSSRMSALVAALPQYKASPTMQVTCTDDRTKYRSVERFKKFAETLPGAQLVTLDGVRVELEKGWLLVRASSNMPALVLVAEGQDMDGLERLYGWLRKGLAGDPDVSDVWENDPWMI